MTNSSMKSVARAPRYSVQPFFCSSVQVQNQFEAARPRSRSGLCISKTPSYSLIVTAGPSRGNIFHLSAAPAYVGRGPDVSLRVDDPRVSSRHLLVWYDADGATYRVRDLNSTNGTFVQHKKLTTEIRLHEGDEILIGNSRLRFSSSAEPKAAATTT
jgi:hypothetical protein